jgi:universal stress protein E
MTIPPKAIRSIVVAVDLGPGTVETLRHTSDLATATGAVVHVVHAHDEPSVLSADRGLLNAQRQVHEKRALLHDFCASAIPRTAHGMERVKAGDAADVIFEAARDTDADVIVIGAHRHRGIADRLVGSTGEKVLRRASIPCLILNGPLRLPVSRILVPLDLSSPSRHALSVGQRWADAVCRHGTGALQVVHVLDRSLEPETAPWTEHELLEDLRKAALETGSTAQPVTLDARVLRGGGTAETLLAHMEAEGVDLLVMGTHNDATLVRALLGSVSAEMVRRAAVPILLVPRVDTKEGANSGPAEVSVAQI